MQCKLSNGGDVREARRRRAGLRVLDNVLAGASGECGTNVYGNDSTHAGREERYDLPLDPTDDFHHYSILWTSDRIINSKYCRIELVLDDAARTVVILLAAREGLLHDAKGAVGFEPGVQVELEAPATIGAGRGDTIFAAVESIAEGRGRGADDGRVEGASVVVLYRNAVVAVRRRRTIHVRRHVQQPVGHGHHTIIHGLGDKAAAGPEGKLRTAMSTAAASFSAWAEAGASAALGHAGTVAADRAAACGYGVTDCSRSHERQIIDTGITTASFQTVLSM
ncbi:unnamed protein product [Miscanthus lutarioriparius]|uniref:GH16 domain-containing protein n=1 Tax=Miscanthus lutarioriparius TaxID=422564 RepID=A0A811SAA9_9POAL|nr:unnamed protein product [Miscanthus lutarioriparius]